MSRHVFHGDSCVVHCASVLCGHMCTSTTMAMWFCLVRMIARRADCTLALSASGALSHLYTAHKPLQVPPFACDISTQRHGLHDQVTGLECRGADVASLAPTHKAHVRSYVPLACLCFKHATHMWCIVHLCFVGICARRQQWQCGFCLVWMTGRRAGCTLPFTA